MLAVLDERSMLENNYKFLFKNEEIDEILAKIYKINLNLNIKTENKNIESFHLCIVRNFVCGNRATV